MQVQEPGEKSHGAHRLLTASDVSSTVLFTEETIHFGAEVGEIDKEIRT